MTSQSANPAGRPLPPPPPDWHQEDAQPPRKERSNLPAKLLVLLIVLILLLSVLFFTPIGKNFMADLNGDSYAESAEITLTREITLDISSGEINWICDIPVPEIIAGGAIQSIQSTDTEPSAAHTEKYGEEWVEWTGTDNSEITLTMTYTATVRTVIWDITPELSGMISDIPADILGRQGGNEWEVTDEDGYPTGEFKIWPTNNAIKTLSDELTSRDLTVVENAQNVFDYIRENIEYLSIPGSEPKACLDTLADGTGDCDDQSMLLISLLRAADIPSWLAFGVLYDRGTEAWGAHAWAEIYMPLADGNSGSVTIDVVNDEFLVRNCNRLEEWKSDGNGDHLSDYYHILSYNYTLANPHQQPPIVEIGDDYTGDYEASAGKVYAGIDLDIQEGALRGLMASRKVF